MTQRLLGLAAVMLLCLAGTASAQDLVSRYVAGEDYTVASAPAARPHDGKVHVAEFFLYSCPHCYHFEPQLEAWQKKLGDDVVFTHVPVLFGQGGETYAKLYYTEEKLGVLGQMHEQIFDAIHQDGNSLATQAAIRQFMVAHGVKASAFDKAFASHYVAQHVNHAIALMRRFQVAAVPSMSVGGRYWVSGRTAGSNKKMLDVVDYLIRRVRRHAKSG